MWGREGIINSERLLRSWLGIIQSQMEGLFYQLIKISSCKSLHYLVLKRFLFQPWKQKLDVLYFDSSSSYNVKNIKCFTRFFVPSGEAPKDDSTTWRREGGWPANPGMAITNFFWKWRKEHTIINWWNSVDYEFIKSVTFHRLCTWDCGRSRDTESVVSDQRAYRLFEKGIGALENEDTTRLFLAKCQMSKSWINVQSIQRR